MKGIRDYGVGSCGPRGFYGTFDAHIYLEEEIANFIGVDEAILYRYCTAILASATGMSETRLTDRFFHELLI